MEPVTPPSLQPASADVQSPPAATVGHEVIAALAADLTWLEQHAVERQADPMVIRRLQLAAALVTNHIGPYLQHVGAKDLQIVVVGGAGSGKSAVTNLLLGRHVAESNPQAGYTRHPIAYVQPGGPLPRATHERARIGRLNKLTEAKPGDFDDHVYQVRMFTQSNGHPISQKAVVWDCPDMTTWQASHYTTRLMECVGLADVVIFVASDERYNDALPTQFLQLILQSGKPVVAVLTKMKAEHVEPLIDHFRSQVVAKLPECTRVAACLGIPFMSAASLADPANQAKPYHDALVQSLQWWIEKPDRTQADVAQHGVRFLRQQKEVLLSVAKADLKALAAWEKTVVEGQKEFTERYVREYLSGEQFPRFNASLVRLLELLEIPGIGQYVSKALYVVRSPYRWIKGAFNKMYPSAPPALLPEEPVLRSSFQHWIDRFHKQSTLEGNHPVWERIRTQFQDGFHQQVTEEFNRLLQPYHDQLNHDVETTARSIYEDLEKNPTALNTLRGTKLTLELATIGGTVVLLGAQFIMNIVLVPLVAALTQELVEIFGSQYVDRQREKTRTRQLELFERTLVSPLAQWMKQWPASSGTPLEALKKVVDRFPAEVSDLEQAIQQRGASSPP